MKPIKLADVRKHTSRRAEQLNPWAPFRPAHGLSPSSTACGRSEPRGRFRLKKDEDLRETPLGVRELGPTDGLSPWLRRVLRHADLPPPPWEGTETITPLRTVAEIHVTGVELRNCLFGDDRSLSAVLGECCY